MAFLCPVRIRRGKKKKSTLGEFDVKVTRGNNLTGMGRITGSASIETLVRVGIEKEHGLSPDSKMVVLHDFTPCVDDELQVKRGQVVNILYRENDWVYVIAEHSRQEGFIPHSYCALYNSPLGELALSNNKKKLPRELRGLNQNQADTEELNKGCHSDITNVLKGGKENKENSGNVNPNAPLTTANGSHESILSEFSSQPDIRPFFQESLGKFIVLYAFVAADENDVDVERGEFVTVMNKEDSDWYWIVRGNGQQGFVPSAFIYPTDVIQNHMTSKQTSNEENQGETSDVAPNAPTPSANDIATPATIPDATAETPITMGATSIVATDADTDSNSMTPAATIANNDIRHRSTELVMLYDYKAQAPDDLSVKRGDWVYADLGNQTVDGWLWSYAPKSRKYGFIPKAYARPPAMTSL